ncbi:uncharacterized protein LOC132698335 [Cylas formicarius]|uniref:uncharacterized protein LOC132698335 n=1 Tax=Cylas formicarius TaxID=197179 RepID=UPI002958D400|nr:uncharacterized protein LOC132698335 [Cylas formicarius]
MTLTGKFAFSFCILWLAFVGKTMSDNVIDVDDILSAKYMPGTLLMLDGPPKSFNTSLNVIDERSSKTLDGTVKDALDTMDFHRSMMNQYLCRSYLASQILAEMNLTGIKKRMGGRGTFEEVARPQEPRAGRTDLLMDQGSSSYKNWLAKSATMEDVYRHYQRDAAKTDRDDEEFDENALKHDDKGLPQVNVHELNYAYQEHSGGQTEKTKNQHKSDVSPYHTGVGGAYYYTPVQTGYVGHSGEEHHDEHITESGHANDQGKYVQSFPPKYHAYHHVSTGYDKSQELADIFEVALTALAYLSFGMFVVHLIMSIYALKSSATTSTGANLMMPTNMGAASASDNSYIYSYTGTGSAPSGSEGAYYTDTGAAASGPGHEIYKDQFKFSHRLRRDAPTIANPNDMLLNDMARKILTSIESALVANADNGDCLKKSLCVNNKYSRELDGFAKYAIPGWSLGMSWLSGRLIENVPPTASMIDSLKASILGLGKANCDVIYQSCDLRKQKELRIKKTSNSTTV